jgi:hypothetical protein
MSNNVMHLVGRTLRLNFDVYTLSEANQWDLSAQAGVRSPGALTTITLAFMSAGGVGERVLNHFESLIISPTNDEETVINRLNRDYLRRTAGEASSYEPQ